MSNDMLGNIIRKLVEIPISHLGVIFDLFEKLTGKESKSWTEALKKFLRGENPWIRNSQQQLVERPVYKTIRRTYQDVEKYTIALRARGDTILVSPSARAMVDHPDFMNGFNLESVDLMVATTKELTEKNNVPTDRVLEAGQELGWSKLPAWVALELCLQYNGKSECGWQEIVMELINGKRFSVQYRDGGVIFLTSYPVEPKITSDESNSWLFRKDSPSV
jgi:hypothetical protein